MAKKIPRFKTDEEAAAFLEQDLSPYLDRKNFTPVLFEFEPKTETVTLRMSKRMMIGVKARAKKWHIPYQKAIRMAVADMLQRAA